MIEVVVDNRIRIRKEQITGEAAIALREAFTHENPYFTKLRKMKLPTGKEPKQIRTYSETKAEFALPRGGMQKVREVLRYHSLAYSTRDARVEGTGPRGLPSHNVELWDHQQDIVEGALRRESGVVRSPTGSGKTTAAISFISEVRLCALVIVYSRNLFGQWVERLEREMGLSKKEIGMIGNGKFRVGPVTIAMQQTLNRRELSREFVEKFGVVIVDECQRAAATTVRKTIDQFPARYRIGFSADETRADGKEFLIYDLFGPVVAEVDQAELERQGVVMDVEIRLEPTEFESPRHLDARRRHHCLHKRARVSDRCSVCGSSGPTPPPNFNKLLDEITTDPYRNDQLMALVEEQVEAGLQTLVLTHRVEHALLIDSMCAGRGIRSGILLGGSEHAVRFEETRAGLRDRSYSVGVGTIQAVGVGQDMPAVAAGILATPVLKNSQLLNQIKGRICRTSEGKTDAVLYLLYDQHIYGASHVRRLNRWFRSVVARHDGAWVDVRTYLKERR